MAPNGYRWVIVALGALMGCVALGAMFSLAVFLTPMSQDTGWSRAGMSFAMTINFLVMAFGAFAWGTATDRWGARYVTLIGAVLLGLGLTLASRATSLLQFQLTYGILVGLAASAFLRADDRHGHRLVRDDPQSRRVADFSAGMGMAPLTISPFATWLIIEHGWRPAMSTIGVVAWVLLIPASLFVRRPPAPAAPRGLGGSRATRAAPAVEPRAHVEALPHPRIHVLRRCAAHSGPSST
jgi:MFS family permease